MKLPVMKPTAASLALGAAGLLPVIFMFVGAAAQACPPGGSYHGGGPTMLQGVMITTIAASILLGTPLLAFGFINLLAGESRGGMLRILTFIGAMGVAVSAIVTLEHLR